MASPPEAPTAPQDAAPDLTPGQQAVVDAKQGITDTVAGLVKQNYVMFKRTYESTYKSDEKLPPPSTDPAFDDYIKKLAAEIVEGDTERAKHIQEIMAKFAAGDEKAQQQLEALKNLPRLSKPLEKTIDKHSGPIFGMNFMDAIKNGFLGLIQWAMSGFEGGFPGLKKTIAQLEINDVKQTFSEELTAAKMDPATTSVGKSAIKLFDQQAKIKAGITEADPKDAAKPLSEVKINGFNPDGDTKVVAPTFDPTKPEELDKAIADHFTKVGDSLAESFGDKVPEKFQPMIDAAKAALITKGGELTKRYLQENKPFDDDFKKDVMAESLKAMKSKVTDPEIATLLDEAIAKFVPGKTLEQISADISNDPATSLASIAVDTMSEQLMVSKGSSLVAILAHAHPENAALKDQAQTVLTSNADPVAAAQEKIDKFNEKIVSQSEINIPKLTKEFIAIKTTENPAIWLGIHANDWMMRIAGRNQEATDMVRAYVEATRMKEGGKLPSERTKLEGARKPTDSELVAFDSLHATAVARDMAPSDKQIKYIATTIGETSKEYLNELAKSGQELPPRDVVAAEITKRVREKFSQETFDSLGPKLGVLNGNLHTDILAQFTSTLNKELTKSDPPKTPNGESSDSGAYQQLSQAYGMLKGLYAKQAEIIAQKAGVSGKLAVSTVGDPSGFKSASYTPASNTSTGTSATL